MKWINKIKELSSLKDSIYYKMKEACYAWLEDEAIRLQQLYRKISDQYLKILNNNNGKNKSIWHKK